MKLKVDQIVALKGVLAVAVLDDDGDLVKLDGAIGGAQAQWLVKTTHAINSLVETQFYAWNVLGGSGFDNLCGWVVVGPAYTVVSGNDGHVCLLQNNETDFNKALPLITDLTGNGNNRQPINGGAVADETRLQGFETSMTWDKTHTITEFSGTEIPERLRGLLAKGCVANMNVLNAQADDYTTLGGVGIERVTTFGVLASLRSVFVRKNRAVVIESAHADFNQAVKANW